MSPFALSLACPELVEGSKCLARLRPAQPERNLSNLNRARTRSASASAVFVMLCLIGAPAVHAQSFSRPAGFVAGEDHTSFALGSNLFHNGTAVLPGAALGRHFSAGACAVCHVADGRGSAYDLTRPPPVANPPRFVDAGNALTLKLDGMGGPPAGPYGSQITSKAVPGTLPKGRVQVAYTPLAGRFADRTPFTLRQPVYRVADLAYGPLAAGTILSPRIAPQLVGLGLLDAVLEDDIEHLARLQAQGAEKLGALNPGSARPPDGVQTSLGRPGKRLVRGRISHIWDPIEERPALGRFGWKAGTASLHHQTGLALLLDMGITTTRFSSTPCAPATPCRTDTPALDDTGFLHLLDYQFGLALPPLPAPRANRQAIAHRGKALFERAQCGACHQPVLSTGKGWFPGMSRQAVHAYTDLLLHDMGHALSDQRVDGAVPSAAVDGEDVALAARSWRTAPLWRIGLIPQVNGHTQLLHDGRARGVMEAILWHGGEAAFSRRQVLGMSRAQRDALVAFVNSL